MYFCSIYCSFSNLDSNIRTLHTSLTNAGGQTDSSRQLSMARSLSGELTEFQLTEHMPVTTLE